MFLLSIDQCCRDRQYQNRVRLILTCFEFQSKSVEVAVHSRCRCDAGAMVQGTHQYQIVYREDKPSLVRIHPVDNAAALSAFSNGSDATTRTDLLQQAHQLYREHKYQNVLTICNHVRFCLCVLSRVLLGSCLGRKPKVLHSVCACTCPGLARPPWLPRSCGLS